VIIYKKAVPFKSTLLVWENFMRPLSDQLLALVQFQWQYACELASRKEWCAAACRLDYFREFTQIWDDRGNSLGTISLARYGISDERVVCLERRVHSRLAAFALYLLRKYTPDGNTSEFRHHVKLSGRRLDDYGITEQELNAHDAENKRHLDELYKIIAES
jgi:hypothetical protein